MGVVFSALGVLAAKTGQAFGSLLGNPTVVTGLAVALLLLASSMFGAFDLSLPTSMQQRLNSVGGAGVAGAFLMGSVSGFLAAPCTGPVLTGLLAFVAKSANTTLGAGLLFVYALGIGVPFFLIGVFTVQLPRGGVWMEWVKNALGIVLVALAVSYLRDAFPWVRETVKDAAAQLGRMPGAFIAGAVTSVGVLIGAVHLSFKEGTREFVIKAVGVVLVVAAITVRVGAMDTPPAGALWVRLGWAEPPKAPVFEWNEVMPTKQASFSREAFDKTLARARAEGKPVLIDFYADWCAACKELERETYPSPEVLAETERFLNIKIDATNSEDALDALMDHFGVQGLPTVAFVSSNGELLQNPRVTGFLEPRPFAEQLRKVR
jgi:thiol:disulfide interchange protein DsbD